MATNAVQKVAWGTTDGIYLNLPSIYELYYEAWILLLLVAIYYNLLLLLNVPSESISYTRCTVNTTINLHSQSNSLSITHPHNRNHATKRHHRRDHHHSLHHHHRPRLRHPPSHPLSRRRRLKLKRQ
ncbi:hypothetical protein O988_03229 [Pseudogymnoascus sp. VKM F-3808]|nr:hypothetical protein O988_03229 [Pseudogymnoascus sp. VKM F-3808]